MTQETLTPAPRELKFGGEGKAESINKGFAISTLRNPRPNYNFNRGESILADCFDDKEKVPVVVLSNEIKRLKDFSIPQLALDGFFSVPHVIDGMKTYPGYEKINKKSEIQVITFVKEETFNELPKVIKDFVLQYSENFNDLIKLRGLRPLFFPTMCLWLTENGGNIQDWTDFLRTNYLITENEKKFVEKYNSKGTDMFRLLKDHPQMLRGIVENPGHSLYAPFVLVKGFYE